MRLLVWAALTTLVLYASSSMSNASLPRKSSISIKFASAVDLPAGTSVILEGRRIGFLSNCELSLSTCDVTLEEDLSVLRNGAMAVVSSTWVDKPSSLHASKANGYAVSFVEILNPEANAALLLDESLTLIGYADFESFWKNTQTKHWVDTEPSPLG